MRRSHRAGLIAMAGVLLVGIAALVLVALWPVDEERAIVLTSFEERAARRLFDGAPPVVPHDDLGDDCGDCHTEKGALIRGVGFAPATPHTKTPGMRLPACNQCHLGRATEEVLVASTYIGLAQRPRAGRRTHPLAPPRMPHGTFMREDCLACHAGEASRVEIRTTHPERVRCRQCHVPIDTPTTFSRAAP